MHTLLFQFRAMGGPCSLHLRGDDDAQMARAARNAIAEVQAGGRRRRLRVFVRRGLLPDDDGSSNERAEEAVLFVQSRRSRSC